MTCVCGDEVIHCGDSRKFDPPGFPFLHQCPPVTIAVPNERDFQKQRTDALEQARMEAEARRQRAR